MNRAMKIGLGMGLGILVVTGGAVFYVLSSLDSIVKSAVERYGSEATQATVRLGDVEISPTTGQGALRGFLVGNPDGFNSPSALKVAGIRIDLDESTLTEPTVVINEIVVDKPVVTYEIGAQGTNIEAIHRNVNAYAGAQKQQRTTGGTAGGGAPSKEGDDLSLVIRRLRITNGTVKVSAGGIAGGNLSATLPTIQLTDVGKDTGGVTPAEMIELVFNAMRWRITASVATINLENMLGSIGKGLEGAADGGVEGAKDVQDLLEKGAASVGKTLKGIVPKLD